MKEEAKVVRRVLVHRNGKVVRVLDQDYKDVTNDMREDGVSEAAHYEDMLKGQQPAPVAEPKAPEVAEEAPAAKKAVERVPFATRMKKANKDLKAIYNELKSDLLAYGVKSRVSFGGDTFRLHNKTYAKFVVAGKTLKIFLALNFADYKDTPIPVIDVSKMVSKADTPVAFKVKSDLSVRRAKQLFADAVTKDGLVKGDVEAHNWVKEL